MSQPEELRKAPGEASSPNAEPTTWKELWHERGLRPREPQRSALREALDADGFDAGPGFLGEETEQRWIGHAISLLELQKHHRVLDCGSGAGAQSMFLSRETAGCVSLDYSVPLLRLGVRLGTVVHPVGGEAGALPFKGGTFERLLCSSVLFYFSDFRYAKRAILEMLRVCKPAGRVVIMDVPDAALREEALRARERARDRTRHRSSADLQHLYYPRSFFGEVAATENCSSSIVDHALTGSEYENAPFRFNVVINKSKGPS